MDWSGVRVLAGMVGFLDTLSSDGGLRRMMKATARTLTGGRALGRSIRTLCWALCRWGCGRVMRPHKCPVGSAQRCQPAHREVRRAPEASTWHRPRLPQSHPLHQQIDPSFTGETSDTPHLSLSHRLKPEVPEDFSARSPMKFR